jgi:hypothetical protein
MNRIIIDYVEATGQIVATCTVPHIEWAGESVEGCVQMEVTDAPSAGRQYISGGLVVEKQPLNLPESIQITADGTDEAVISNIPAGVTVQWPDGQIDEVTDGEVRFAVDLPGTYTLTFDAVPYLEQEVTIEAVAAT